MVTDSTRYTSGVAKNTILIYRAKAITAVKEFVEFIASSPMTSLLSDI